MLLFRLIGKLLYGDDFDKYSGNQTSQKYIPKDRRLKPSAGNKKRPVVLTGLFLCFMYGTNRIYYGSKNDAEKTTAMSTAKKTAGCAVTYRAGSSENLGHARHLVN